MDKLKAIESKRSGKWPTVRKKFLKGKSCAVCGGTKKLEAHHKQPFHLHPALELDESNLIALCEGNKEINCHLFVGHLGNFKGYNPDVEADAALWNAKLKANKIRIAQTQKALCKSKVLQKKIR